MKEAAVIVVGEPEARRYELRKGLKFIDPSCRFAYFATTTELTNTENWINFDCSKCRIKSKCLDPEAYSKTTWEQEILPNLKETRASPPELGQRLRRCNAEIDEDITEPSPCVECNQPFCYWKSKSPDECLLKRFRVAF